MDRRSNAAVESHDQRLRTDQAEKLNGHCVGTAIFVLPLHRLRAVVFDFDGLVLDTESTWFAVWGSVFATHGLVYELADFHKIVGAENSAEDPRVLLEKRTGRKLDWSALNVEISRDECERNSRLAPMPGVAAIIRSARGLGCQCAIASNSRHDWVDRHLRTLRLFDEFDAIVCRDDVARAKPEPDLYLEALRRLGVSAANALALEDSHNGSLAAKRAGLSCVVVPGPTTRTQNFAHADLVLVSLENADLPTLWCATQGSRGRPAKHQ